MLVWKSAIKFLVNLMLITFLVSFIYGQDTDPKQAADVAKKKREFLVQQPADTLDLKIYKIVVRSNDNRFAGLIVRSIWTATHDYKNSDAVDLALTRFADFNDAFLEYASGNKKKLEELGGLEEYSVFLRELLKNDDQALRSFGAVLMGVAGLREYSAPLKDFLSVRADRNDSIVYDRNRAAIAIGMIGDVEYIPTLLELLVSENEFDRIGGLIGLGFMRAESQRTTISGLLKDASEEVREAAETALVMLDGEEKK